MFAKACQIICILHQQILLKTRFVKPQLQNLAKVYLLPALPHPPGPPQYQPSQPVHPQLLKTLHHYHPQTNCKRCLSVHCMPQMLHYPGMPTNVATYDEIQSYTVVLSAKVHAQIT